MNRSQDFQCYLTWYSHTFDYSGLTDEQRMLLYVTIGILFTYTILLIGFFMGWCTLIPNRCHPRRGIPFSSVKSPRRNTKFVEVDSVSSSTSLDMYRQVSRKFSKAEKQQQKRSLSNPPRPYHVNDYLHPKYSLPPVSIDLVERRWEFEQLLRTPGRAVRDNTQRVDSCPA